MLAADLWRSDMSTAHDVAEDMVDASLSSVTLIQRSPTRKYIVAFCRYQGHS